jgi:hypothetical protein
MVPEGLFKIIMSIFALDDSQARVDGNIMLGGIRRKWHEERLKLRQRC